MVVSRRFINLQLVVGRPPSRASGSSYHGLWSGFMLVINMPIRICSDRRTVSGKYVLVFRICHPVLVLCLSYFFIRVHLSWPYFSRLQIFITTVELSGVTVFFYYMRTVVDNVHRVVVIFKTAVLEYPELCSDSYFDLFARYSRVNSVTHLGDRFESMNYHSTLKSPDCSCLRQHSSHFFFVVYSYCCPPPGPHD